MWSPSGVFGWPGRDMGGTVAFLFIEAGHVGVRGRGQTCHNALFRPSCAPPKASLVSDHLPATADQHVRWGGVGGGTTHTPQACSFSDYMAIKHLLKERGEWGGGDWSKAGQQHLERRRVIKG